MRSRRELSNAFATVLRISHAAIPCPLNAGSIVMLNSASSLLVETILVVPIGTPRFSKINSTDAGSQSRSENHRVCSSHEICWGENDAWRPWLSFAHLHSTRESA